MLTCFAKFSKSSHVCIAQPDDGKISLKWSCKTLFSSLFCIEWNCIETFFNVFSRLFVCYWLTSWSVTNIIRFSVNISRRVPKLRIFPSALLIRLLFSTNFCQRLQYFSATAPLIIYSYRSIYTVFPSRLLVQDCLIWMWNFQHVSFESLKWRKFKNLPSFDEDE